MSCNKDGVAEQFGPVMWRQLFIKISRKYVDREHFEMSKVSAFIQRIQTAMYA